MIQLGNERLFGDDFHLIKGRRVGLVTNPSGVNSALQSTADRLCAAGGVELTALFGPEHGIRGDLEDGVRLGPATDARTGVTVFSLYGETRRPLDHMLENVDVLVVDIQEVGVRFYTYLYTMSMAMEACAERSLPVVVLDRPNPIGGELVEGNILDPEFASFVGMYPIAVRHGMTIGELARLFSSVHDIDVELHVVELRGWDRDQYWDETGLPWVAPSPNMPTVDTAVVYPGMCFFEGTNISEGRGTTKPFEQIGSPYIDGDALAGVLNDLNLPGAAFRPVFFRPSFGKYAGESCRGIQVHVLDRSVFRAVSVGFGILAAVRGMYPGAFEWRVPNRGIHNFDKLAGTDRVRRAIDAGTSAADLERDWARDRRLFMEQRQSCLLYPQAAAIDTNRA
jgi:beta-N-acetylhexosaminidase